MPPLRFNGTDSTLKPLERGMAELIITDLSRSARLTVVERDRMQALADEIQLLCTTRIPLKLRGERGVMLGSLALDDASFAKSRKLRDLALAGDQAAGARERRRDERLGLVALAGLVRVHRRRGRGHRP